MKKLIFVLFAMCTMFVVFAQNTRKFSMTQIDVSIGQNNIYTPTGNVPEIVVQEGNSGGVEILQYTSDGKYLLAGTFSDVKVYDAESGYLLKSFEGVSCKGFSPGGKYFVWLSYSEEDYGIRITNIETGKEKIIGEINRKKSNYVRANTKFAFSPDGKYLAVPMVDWVDIYYVETFEQKEVLKTRLLENFAVNSIQGWEFCDAITWSPNSKFINCITTKTEESIGSYNLIYEVTRGYIEHFTGVIGYSLKYPTFSQNSKFVAFAGFFKNGVSNIYILDTEKGGSPKVFPVKNQSIYGLQFTPDGQELLVLHKYSYSRFKSKDNWENGEERSLNADGVSCSFVISQNSEKFVRGVYRDIQIFNLAEGRFIKSLKGASKLEKFYRNSKSGGFFTSNESLENPLILDEKFVFQKNFIRFPKDASDIFDFANFDGGFYYHEKNSNKIMCYEFSTGRISEVLDLNENIEYLSCMVSSADGNNISLYRKSKGWTEFYKKIEGKLVKVKYFETDGGFHNRYSRFNADGTMFFAAAYPGKVGYVIDFEKNKLGKIFTDVSAGEFTSDGKYFAAYQGSGYTEIYNTATWEVIKKFEYFNSLPFFSHDSRYLAMYALDNKSGTLGIDIYDTSSWKKNQRVDAPHIALKTYFNSDGSKIFELDSSGMIRCYSVMTGKLLANFMYDSDEDYFTYTPEGYFSGSPGGINKFVHLVDGMQVFELGQLYDTLYRPDLVQAKLEGKDVGGNPLKKIVETGNAPSVKFTKAPFATSRNVTLNFSVQDTGGGIGFVYLAQNGKAIQISKGEKSKTGRIFNFSCEVTLAKGENIFEAYAANSANKIESRHASVSLNWQGNVETANLYVLALGVDKYSKMPQNNLRYSVADANAIIESFKTAPGGMYESVNVLSLLDADVNSSKIQKAFNAFAAKVKPDDTFILYLAGHGTNYDGEYYYLPADILIKKESEIPKVGISKHFLTEHLSKIGALNTILMLDTCYSGAFIDANASANELSQKTALEHLSHTSGQVILTASSNSQTASEGYEGHGIFTYAILEALSGKANYNSDSNITVKEVVQYIGYEIPIIYEKMGQARQRPWNSPLRGDFSVVAGGKKTPSKWYLVSLDGANENAVTALVTVDDSGVLNKSDSRKKSRDNQSESISFNDYISIHSLSLSIPFSRKSGTAEFDHYADYHADTDLSFNAFAVNFSYSRTTVETSHFSKFLNCELGWGHGAFEKFEGVSVSMSGWSTAFLFGLGYAPIVHEKTIFAFHGIFGYNLIAVDGEDNEIKDSVVDVSFLLLGVNAQLVYQINQKLDICLGMSFSTSVIGMFSGRRVDRDSRKSFDWDSGSGGLYIHNRIGLCWKFVE